MNEASSGSQRERSRLRFDELNPESWPSPPLSACWAIWQALAYYTKLPKIPESGDLLPFLARELVPAVREAVQEHLVGVHPYGFAGGSDQRQVSVASAFLVALDQLSTYVGQIHGCCDHLHRAGIQL